MLNQKRSPSSLTPYQEREKKFEQVYWVENTSYIKLNDHTWTKV